MKQPIMIKIMLITWLVTITACSTTYLKQPFTDFSKSTNTIGKNTTKCFEQLFEEEINTRIAESNKQNSMNKSLLEPKVLTWNQLELRKELINYINNYVNLLESIVKPDYNKDILKNAKQIEDNLDYISTNHEFLNKKEIAFLTMSATSLAETLTASARRSFLIKIMNQHQPILEQTVHRLISELMTTGDIVNNFFDRQFLLQVSFPWPEKESSREKYAKIGAKILKRKRQINSRIRDVIDALYLIPNTHQELNQLLKYNDSPVRTLLQLTNFAAKLEEMYVDIANKK